MYFSPVEEVRCFWISTILRITSNFWEQELERHFADALFPLSTSPIEDFILWNLNTFVLICPVLIETFDDMEAIGALLVNHIMHRLLDDMFLCLEESLPISVDSTEKWTTKSNWFLKETIYSRLYLEMFIESVLLSIEKLLRHIVLDEEAEPTAEYLERHMVLSVVLVLLELVQSLAIVVSPVQSFVRNVGGLIDLLRSELFSIIVSHWLDICFGIDIFDYHVGHWVLIVNKV